MEINQEIYDRIDRYLQGKMGDQELVDFESELSKDDKLSGIVEREREIINGIRRSAKIDFQKELDEIHATIDDNKSQTESQKKEDHDDVATPKNNKLWLLLGGLVLISLLAFFLWPKPEQQKVEEVPEKIYAATRPVWTGSIPVYDESVLKNNTAIASAEKIDEINMFVFIQKNEPSTYVFDTKEKALKLYIPTAIDVNKVRPVIYQISDYWILSLDEVYYSIEASASPTPLKKVDRSF